VELEATEEVTDDDEPGVQEWVQCAWVAGVQKSALVAVNHSVIILAY
jgi:hypothetical protein